MVAPVTRGEGGGEGDGGLPWVMMDRKDEAFVSFSCGGACVWGPCSQADGNSK